MYGQGAAGAGRGAEKDRRLDNGYLHGTPRNHPDEGRWGSERMGEQNIPDTAQQPCQDTSRDPQYMGGFSMILPNQSKREKTQTIAKQELENWERFKEARKPGPIKLTPKNLGGGITEGEARWNQQLTQSQSRYQKMLKREEYKTKQREEEEAQIQKMKNIQRQKAEKLEEKKRQQEAQRQIEYSGDRYRRNNEFLDRLSLTETSYQNQTQECSGNAYKARIQREEYKNKQRAEEEAMIQAAKLEEKARQQELERQMKWQEDKYQTNSAFLNQMSWPAESYEEYEEYTNQSDEDLPTAWALNHDYRQEKKVQEQRQLEQMKEEQRIMALSHAYRQEQKAQEQRQLQQMKEEQRRKSELLDVTRIKQEKESRLTEQEERRRVNNAFLDRLQGKNWGN
ncbi:epithelial-stromal interaction protein 1 isoform X2 [Xenopus laevis]|uniref:Epithelial-stromal interaction protein 1 isoform X2 n=1 Tax=Xenopus laevis TaxID=8355 RepID=A0A8J1M9M3_XENLA|nr:epithelial-stromal interaction protein 1 isoform X2 [Xenopus laevis]